MDSASAIEGLVIDVERFALHDDPGIRSTVFLKGCPLLCQWCHNPESMDVRPQSLIRYDRCPDCLRSGHVCAFAVRLDMSGDDGDIVHDRDRAVVVDPAKCPHAAVRSVGRWRSVESVLREVSEDMPFYASSGGGMTISGGEPMQQFEFTRALLTAAKAARISTCLDTSGYASTRRYIALLPFVDLFLFDYKATDSDKHRTFTGVPNERILANLHKLLAHGAQIILRCPLVPGVNDDEGNLAGIADLSRRYPQFAGVEIMPFHNLGREKWRGLGVENPLVGLATAGLADRDGWASKLRAFGARLIDG